MEPDEEAGPRKREEEAAMSGNGRDTSMKFVNDTLCDSLRRLADPALLEDPGRLERELSVAKAMADTAREITANKSTVLKAIRLADELGMGGVLSAVTGDEKHAELLPGGKAK
jgi:hypothetical protein